jgi:antitoxin (DNA-binding transcriptional repressor) of toxin-antitoxin stability system
MVEQQSARVHHAPEEKRQMSTVTLHQAQTQLAELIRQHKPGDAITITENQKPVARLVVLAAEPTWTARPRPPVTGTPKAGRWRGQLVVPPDFDAPLEELREYMG